MSSSKYYIDQHLSGKSSKHLIDSLMDDLPSEDEIRRAVLSYMPKGTKIEFTEDFNNDILVVLKHKNKDALEESLFSLESAYPEVNFVIK